jgi:hypothetical protein
LCVEGDCETVTHRSQIGQRHAPRLAGHLPVDGLGYFIQGCEALALVASQGDVEATKGKLDGRLGSDARNTRSPKSSRRRLGGPGSRSCRAECGDWPIWLSMVNGT